MRKISLPSGFDPQTVQPIASRCCVIGLNGVDANSIAGDVCDRSTTATFSPARLTQDRNRRIVCVRIHACCVVEVVERSLLTWKMASLVIRYLYNTGGKGGAERGGLWLSSPLSDRCHL